MPCPDGILPISPHHDHRRAARPPPGGAATALHPRARAWPRRHGRRLPGPRPPPRPGGRPQGPPPFSRPEPRRRAVPARDPDGRPAAASRTSSRSTTPATPTASSGSPCPTSRARRSADGSSARGSCRWPTRSGSRARSPTASTTPTARASIHRDVKPENILLSEGHALVADFGISRAIAGDEGGEALTETGVTVGTPAYMSPEQATGQPVDARTDVYALGAVLYEMLAGEPPFTGTDAAGGDRQALPHRRRAAPRGAAVGARARGARRGPRARPGAEPIGSPPPPSWRGRSRATRRRPRR